MRPRDPSQAFRAAIAAFIGLATAFSLVAIKLRMREAQEFSGILPFVVVASMSAFGAVVVFLARWTGVYRSDEEWRAIKEAGLYRKSDESRRAVAVVIFGVAVVLAILGGLWVLERITGYNYG